MEHGPISQIDFQGGLDVSAPPLSPASEATLGEGSWNAIVSGSGLTRPWAGGTSQGSGTGSAKMLPFGNTWGGIKGIAYSDKTFTAISSNSATISNHGYNTGVSCQLTTTGSLPTGLSLATTYYIVVVDANTIKFASSLANAIAGTTLSPTNGTGSGTHTVDVTALTVTASGSFFQDIGKSRWGIGAGVPHIEGVSVPGFALSTNLQLQIATSGVYTTPVQAGLAQPSAPDVGVTATVGDISNSVSVKIERTRPATGARSLASPSSAVIVPQANRVRVTFPVASTGQTHWRVYFTFQGFGGTGVNYLTQYLTYTDIPEATVSAGTVEGVSRSLEFNYKDGDLIPIEASFDDYPPPAATHALRLQNVLTLPGCYADSAADPTSTSPGTAIAVSKENNYESYVPTSLLFLPEQVVDCLARPVDDYGYIACQNSIHAIQYVGDRGDGLPSCTLTTVLPDIGIQYAQNWCYFRGQLLIYAGSGNLLLMDESGNFDTTFAAPVTKILKGWSTATTVVGYDPKNDSLLVMKGSRVLVYSLQLRQWRQIWLPDYSINGNVIACVAAKRALYFSTQDKTTGILTAYTYDTGSTTAPLSFCSNYQGAGGYKVRDIYELAVAAQTNVNTSLAVAVNRNLAPTVFRQIQTTSGSPTITESDGAFTANMLGKKVILFGADVGGSGTVLLQATVTSVAGVGSTLGLSANVQATLTDCLMFMGDYTAVQPAFGPDLLKTFTAAAISGSTITIASHGFADRAAVRFSIGSGGTLPTLITSGQRYFVNVLSANTFNVSATPGGTPISLAGAASNLCVAQYGFTHLPNFMPNLPEVRSHQVAIWFKAVGDVGNVLGVELIGTEYSSNRAL